MKVTINPSLLAGVLQAPASKSSMQRACAAALLNKGTSVIKNFGNSNDEKTALTVVEKLGAEIEKGNKRIVVKCDGVSVKTNEINCGESGLFTRMITPIAALSKKKIRITGEGSLQFRPFHFFDTVFPQLGVKIKTSNGKLPLFIQGPLSPKSIEIDGSLSSQFLTGLLMAFSAADAKNVTIYVRNLKSFPYIDLTLNVMKKFGMKVPKNNNYESFYFSPKSFNQQYKTCNYKIERDWSNAAFLLVAGAIAGSITVRGLDLNSAQSDKAILIALTKANANIEVEKNSIRIGISKLKSFEFDATNCPDLFPPLVALAAYCKGNTRIKGVTRLKHKESNRGLTLKQEFGKMGVKIELLKDEMVIHGAKKIKGAVVHSHNDHRIAMACAVAALRATNNTEINKAQAVNKSYPDFFRDLEKLGAVVSLNKS